VTTHAQHHLLSTSDQLPGIFRGRYEVVRRLPGGMHGPSWQVREAESGAPLVLRHLAAGAGADLLFAGNLRRLTLAAARSADAVHVQEVLEDGNAVWLARDWVQGENLGDALDILGSLTPAQGRAVIGAACRGLLVEERDLLVHGNLRPENVLIDPNGRAVVSDHGLRIVGTRTALAQPLVYLAPELLAGEPPSPAADVYALGALLYTAVCGRYPLALTGDPSADREVLAAHQIIQPPARVDLSGGLGHVIWKALQPRPTDRFPTALDMLIALGRPGALELTSSAQARAGRFFR
jgi:serine/threonine-protein kinase